MDNQHGDIDEHGDILDELDHEEAIVRLYELRDRYAEAADTTAQSVGVDVLLERWARWWSDRGFDPSKDGPWVFLPGSSSARGDAPLQTPIDERHDREGRSVERCI